MSLTVNMQRSLTEDGFILSSEHQREYLNSLEPKSPSGTNACKASTNCGANCDNLLYINVWVISSYARQRPAPGEDQDTNM
jgi:hypothetical protein